jgi:hypothetical protein
MADTNTEEKEDIRYYVNKRAYIAKKHTINETDINDFIAQKTTDFKKYAKEKHLSLKVFTVKLIEHFVLKELKSMAN